VATFGQRMPGGVIRAEIQAHDTPIPAQMPWQCGTVTSDGSGSEIFDPGWVSHLWFGF